MVNLDLFALLTLEAQEYARTIPDDGERLVFVPASVEPLTDLAGTIVGAEGRIRVLHADGSPVGSFGPIRAHLVDYPDLCIAGG